MVEAVVVPISPGDIYKSLFFHFPVPFLDSHKFFLSSLVNQLCIGESQCFLGISKEACFLCNMKYVSAK